MKLFKLMKFAALFAALLMILIACPNGPAPTSETEGQEDGANAVKGISVTYESGTAIDDPVYLTVGNTENLLIALTPAGITGVVAWSGGNAYVGVDAASGGMSAELEGLGIGTATITVSATNSDTVTPVTVSFNVEVIDATELPVQSLIVKQGEDVIADNHAFDIFEGSSITLSATPGPEGVDGVAITWDGPASLTITPESGGLSATVTGTAAGGPYTFTVSASNSNNLTPVTRTFTATVLTRAAAPLNWAQVGYTDFAIGKPARNINSVAYDGTGRFVAAGNNGDVVYSGTDMVWTASATGGGDVRGITYVGGNFYAAAYTAAPTLRYSTDGITWQTESQVTIASLLGIGTDGDQRIGIVGLNSQGFTYTNNGGSSWVGANLSNSNWGNSKNLRGVAYGNDVAVIVGDAGGIMYAPLDNMRQGFLVTTAPHTATYIDVVFGGGKFVAVGAGNSVAWSNDGITWQAGTGVTNAAQINDVTYADGWFVLGGSNVFYSQDGANWIASTTQPGFTVQGLVYGGDKWVAVGNDGKIAYSGGAASVKKPVRGMTVFEGILPIENGHQFSITDAVESFVDLTINLTPAEAERNITWVADPALTVTETDEGITVTSDTTGGPYTVTLTATNADNTVTGKPAATHSFTVKVVPSTDPVPVDKIILREGSTDISDGQSFTLNVTGTKTLSVTLLDPNNVPTDGIVTWMPDDNANVGIAVDPDGLSATITGTSITTAPVTFTVSAQNADNAGTPATFTFTVSVAKPPAGWNTAGVTAFGTAGGDTDSVDGVAYGNGAWVAVGRNNGTGALRYSTDGKTTWNTPTFEGATPTGVMRAVFFDGTQFIAAGVGNLYTSTDGINWSAPIVVTPYNNGTFSHISYGGGRYVIVSTGTNRVVWTDVNVGLSDFSAPSSSTGGTDAIMSAAAYAKINGVDTWVIVGRAAGGAAQVRVTNDFVTFKNNADMTGPIPVGNLNGVAYGNGRFVAVGASGAVIQSTDGLTWTSVNANLNPATTSMNVVVFTNGYFVAGGDSNTVRYSADGITWTAANTSGNNNPNPHIRSIAFGGNIWLAGGRGGNLFYADVTP